MNSSCLFVGNLPTHESSVIRRAIGDYFSRYGPILDVDFCDDYAVVRLSNSLAVQDAIKFEQGADILGSHLLLSSEPPHPEGGTIESADGHSWIPPSAKRHCTGLYRQSESLPTSANYHEEVSSHGQPVSLVATSGCGLIVLDKIVTAYAKHVEARVSSLGLTVDTVFIGQESSVYQIIEEMVSRRLLYVFIVHPSNEQHESVSLKILCSIPQQDHRNLPLSEALHICRSHFEERQAAIESSAKSMKMSSGDPPVSEPVTAAVSSGNMREADSAAEVEPPAPVPVSASAPATSVKPPPPFIAQLMEFVCENRPLSVDEYDSLVSYLEKHRNHLQTGDDAPDIGRRPLIESKVNNGLDSASHSTETVPLLGGDNGFSSETARRPALSSTSGPAASGNRIGISADVGASKIASRFTRFDGLSDASSLPEYPGKSMPADARGTMRAVLGANGERFSGSMVGERHGGTAPSRDGCRSDYKSAYRPCTADGTRTSSAQPLQASSARDCAWSSGMSGGHEFVHSSESQSYTPNMSGSGEPSEFGRSGYEDGEPNELPSSAGSRQSIGNVPVGSRRPPILPNPHSSADGLPQTGGSDQSDQLHQPHLLPRTPLGSAEAGWKGYPNQHHPPPPVHPPVHRPRIPPASDPNRHMVRPRAPMPHRHRGPRPQFVRMPPRPVNTHPRHPHGPRPVRY